MTFVALEIKSLAGGLTTVDGLVAQAVQYVPSRRRGYPKSEKPWPTKNAASRKSARENDHSVPAAAPDAGKPRRSSCVADYAACAARLFCGRGLRTLRFSHFQPIHVPVTDMAMPPSISGSTSKSHSGRAP